MPRALALDGGGEEEEEEEKKGVLSPSSSSRKRTRATANEDAANTDADVGTRPSSNKRQTTTRTKGGRGKREKAQEEEGGGREGEGGRGEESSGQPSPSKRYRISVTSDYNTRFKADRRGRVSDPGPGRRRPRVSFAATAARGLSATPRSGRVASRRGPAARARSGSSGRARMRAVTLGGQQDRAAVGGRRVRLVEPGSSETADENDGDDEGVGGPASAVVVVRRVVPSVGGERKRRGVVNGVDEGQGSAKRARKGRRPPGIQRAGVVAPKLVFDGIDVPRLSKAVVEAIRKREMVLYDEDADGEVDETVGGAGGEEGAGDEGVAPEPAGEEVVGEEGAGKEDAGEQGVAPESVGEEGASEEGVAPEGAGAPEGGYEVIMPADEGEPEGGAEEEVEYEEDEAQLEELIPDDSSSLGNSNKGTCVV